MKYTSHLLAVFLICAGFRLAAADTTGLDILRRMHKAHYHAPCKIYTFSQKNTHYRNDSVIGHSDWHEAIEFPSKFRIDFDNPADGNFVMFRNDSVLNYKAGVLVKQRAEANTLLLLLGGMYYRELEEVIARLKTKKYDLQVYSEQRWENAAVYVIGAKLNDLVSNQVWVDKKTLRVLRIIEQKKEQQTMDMRFEAFQKWCGGYVETKVSFRRNGKLEQVEEYYDIKQADKFPGE